MLILAHQLAPADHDLLWAAVVTGGLAFLGTVIVAFLANQNKKAAKDVAAEILAELNTGNGHTAGDALSRIEEEMWRHENRLDSIEVRLMEGQEIFDEIHSKIEQHEFETRPIRDWAVEQMEQREEQEDG